MTGKEMYESNRDFAACMEIVLPPWESLSATARAGWEHDAFEQALRDRELPKGAYNARPE